MLDGSCVMCNQIDIAGALRQAEVGHCAGLFAFRGTNGAGSSLPALRPPRSRRRSSVADTAAILATAIGTERATGKFQEKAMSIERALVVAILVILVIFLATRLL